MSDSDHTRLRDSLQWALDASCDPAMAAADWLATDIDPDAASAVDLITRATTNLDHLHQAKSAFKTMRIIGETSADRRLAARLYAGTIAAGLTHHDTRISGQSDSALRRAFDGLQRDESMPDALRELARSALDHLATS